VLHNGNVEEDIDHLFFSCPFALSCWAKLGFVWNLDVDTRDRVLEAARINASEFFMEVFLIAAWEIWNLRNSVIFDNDVASVASWVRKFKSQGYLQLVRVQEDKQASFISL
jgi:hypothetical protein